MRSRDINPWRIWLRILIILRLASFAGSFDVLMGDVRSQRGSRTEKLSQQLPIETTGAQKLNGHPQIRPDGEKNTFAKAIGARRAFALRAHTPVVIADRKAKASVIPSTWSRRRIWGKWGLVVLVWCLIPCDSSEGGEALTRPMLRAGGGPSEANEVIRAERARNAMANLR